MKRIENEKGITLIALVITIIVLIILAMVTIATLTGPNGILDETEKAKEENDKGEIQDQIETEIMGSYEEEKLN